MESTPEATQLSQSGNDFDLSSISQGGRVN
jgi:hypothetical protein